MCTQWSVAQGLRFDLKKQPQHNDTLFTYNATTLFSEPITTSNKRITQLAMGDVAVLDSTLGLITLLDTASKQYFLPVRIKNKTGYLSTDDLAIGQFAMDQNGTLLLVKWPSLKTGSGTPLTVKAITEIRTTTEIEVPIYGEKIKLEVSNHKGLSNIRSLVHLNFEDSVQEQKLTTTLLTWNGEQLKELGTLISVKSDVHEVKEEYIFPSDEGGKSETVIYKRHETLHIDPITNWVKSNQENRELHWDGSGLK